MVLAQTTDDVRHTLRFCDEHGIPVTARGTGTGLSGGCVPTPGAVVLSTERMTELEVQPEHKLAICGPGVITEHLMKAANEHGLAYPPDPASFAECSIGGNVAENAGGLRCKRFGVTRDYIIGLEAALADGSILHTGALGDGTGFDLGSVLIGSEGTLAVITRIAVRLIDAPGHGNTLLVTFETPEAAAQSVTDITASGMIPTVLEYMDGDSVACANAYEPADGLDNAGALLLIETSDHNPDQQTARIEEICRSNHCAYLRIESNPKRAEDLWRVRRNQTYAAKSQAALRVSEDIAVPNNRFPDMVAFVADLNQKSDLRINSYGHAGDGNLHVNFMSSEGTSENHAKIESLVDILMRHALKLGGTITGEHGVGLAKRQFLPLEFDKPTLAAMRAIKEVCDPHGSLNPDKLLPA